MKGFTETTVDDIAQDATVSRGSLFWHFGTKEQLLWAVVEETFVTWVQAGMVADVGDAQGLDALRQALASHRRMVREHRDVWRLYHVLLGEALGPRAALAERFLALHGTLRGRVRAWITQGVASGELSCADPATTSIVLTAAVSGLVGHWLLDTDALDFDRAYDELERIVEAALGVRSVTAVRLTRVRTRSRT